MEDASALVSTRVLVIDDDDVARQTMVELLRGEGHEVSSLPSPIGATKHVLQAAVEVVVIDVMMPSLRGDKLAALLTRNPRLRNLGVVLVTGAPIEQMQQIAGTVNASAVIAKDRAHEELDAAVRRAARPGPKTSGLPPQR